MGRLAITSIVCGLLLTTAVAAGAQRGTAAPRNLQVLTPDVDLPRLMQSFNAALGVQCTHCHVPGDFASDGNPKKAVARTMLRLQHRVAARFPDSGNDFANSRYLPFPEGKQYVTCVTCHQLRADRIALGVETVRPAEYAAYRKNRRDHHAHGRTREVEASRRHAQARLGRRVGESDRDDLEP